MENIARFIVLIVPLERNLRTLKRYSHLKISRPPSTWQRAVGGFVLALWIFGFSSNSFASEAYNFFEVKKSALNTHITVSELSANIDSSTPHPFNPNLPNSLPEEQDELDEKEKEDHSEDSWKIICRPSIRYDTSLEEILTANNTQPIRDGNSVYLFILFHSWKIFLA